MIHVCGMWMNVSMCKRKKREKKRKHTEHTLVFCCVYVSYKPIPYIFSFIRFFVLFMALLFISCVTFSLLLDLG